MSVGAEAKQAGRGVVYIAAAKLYFMVAGAVIEFILPALVSTAVFGAYGVVAATVSPLNNVIVTGTIQMVSRFTAQEPERARAFQAAGFRVQLLIGLPIAAVFVALAPVFAAGFRDASKIAPFMLAGGVFTAYAFYAVFVGSANGRKRFGIQAGLDMAAASLRALGILLLAAAGFGVLGVIAGWVAAASSMLIIAAIAVGMPRGAAPAPLAPMVRFFASVAVYLVLLNLIMVADTYLLKRLAGDWFAAHADTIAPALASAQPSWADVIIGFDPARHADVQVGYYRAVQNLARLSYQAIIAVTFVVFPLVSRSTFASDENATRAYVRNTLRYSLIFAGALGAVLAANPEELLDVPYRAEFARVGGTALIALSLGSVGFAVFAIAGTILNGAARTRDAIALAAFTLVTAVVANALLIPRFAPGSDLLTACAAATGGSMLLGGAAGLLVLQRRFGASAPLATVLRVIAATALAMLIGRLIPFAGSIATLAEAAVIGMVYLLALVASRELTGADYRALRGVLAPSR
jgi:O-antigen/teichoic acid export membrane protein